MRKPSNRRAALVVALLLAAIGSAWLLIRRPGAGLRASRPAEPTAPAQPTAPAEPTSLAGPAAERVAAAPAPEVPLPDLVAIDGIGPRTATALRTAGITTVAELAACDEALLRAAVQADGLRFTPTLPTWPAQARALLADAAGAGSPPAGGVARVRDAGPGAAP